MPERSKVIYNGTTLIDLTEDSVTPETLAYGVTAHSASGDIITGIAYKNTYYVAGTQTQSTNSWTGVLNEVSNLFNGLAIDYWLPYESYGDTTLNLTLKDGTTTGPINIYIYGITRMTNRINSGSIVRLVYQTVLIDGISYTGWWGSEFFSNSDSGLLSIENSNVFTGSINYRKIGKTVEISAHRIALVSPVFSGNYVELGIIPEGFRPNPGMYSASVSNDLKHSGSGFNLMSYNVGSRSTKSFVVEVDSNGNIILYAVGASILISDNINISAMYFTE